MKPVVELECVDKCFGSFRALNALSLRVGEGEIVGLLGHNGAGKTTTMKLILGLITPSAGHLRVFDEQPSLQRTGEHRRRTGFLPENVSFYQHLSGREVRVYFARLKGLAGQEVQKLLDRVGLAAAADRRVKTYSKGMRQRLGLAQALLGEPQLLMLDEPTAGLDPAATGEFYSMLDELRGRGTTVLLSSHVLPGIEGHIDRALILGRGQLLAEGSLDSLRTMAALPMVIRATGQWTNLDPQQFSDTGMRVSRLDGRELELTGPEAVKLPVLKRLLELPETEDVKLFPPTLDALYAHFNRDCAQQESEIPCAPS